MKVVVVDDEAPARDELVYLLKQHGGLQVVGEAEDAPSAMQVLRRERPDAVFLDISMPGGDGLEVARQLARQAHPPLVVFATAYDRHALEAFEVNAVDYLLKPFSEQRVAETIDKLRRLVKQRKADAHPLQNKIAVSNEDLITLLDPADIIFAGRRGREVFVKTYDQEFKVNYTLQGLEQRLDAEFFFRPHHGFLVNVNKIEKIEPAFQGYQLVMKDNTASRVPVSRSGMKEMKRLLGI
ncbi:LytR/AlgR family response regulator transcription factor [Desulforamulus hydrothermalis]|uniref:Stage 0 sporulation protein A homolog n=1 Tax=Desulforamulus hydrothermalis Lam5 = DSM 18033 TaxID=1121428 RepID=K8DXS5_9FIRM|nr:LytTR family DNA-binding domain-containing protein [Desulforamulus hydrothermalis]CCO07532.1 putative response regulator in two-component system with YpdA [Desulforamulus hydrothermalis Lam5 = DSM 18033]SHH30771.1 two component transcriptional regulator, LytTR family [Desulforamulus hydrothermalis Lam5 = DSM 18033]